MTGWEVSPPPQKTGDDVLEDSEDVSGDDLIRREAGDTRRQQVLVTITSHCLPKLVCQLHSMEDTQALTSSERNLMALVGSVSIFNNNGKVDS